MLIPLSFRSLSSPHSPAFLYAFCTSLLQKDFSFVLFDAQTVSLGATAEDCQVDEKPQALGVKPSLSLCPCSPSSASQVGTDIILCPFSLLSWGGYCTVNYESAYAPCCFRPQFTRLPVNPTLWIKMGNKMVSLLTLMAPGPPVFCCFNPPRILPWQKGDALQWITTGSPF